MDANGSKFASVCVGGAVVVWLGWLFACVYWQSVLLLVQRASNCEWRVILSAGCCQCWPLALLRLSGYSGGAAGAIAVARSGVGGGAAAALAMALAQCRPSAA